MPLMQACFTRCGEPIPMRVDKMNYLFMENHCGDFVANISDPGHVKHLLETKNFKMYEPPTEKELAARAKAEAVETAKAEVKAEAKADVKGKAQPRGKKQLSKAPDDSDLDSLFDGEI